jgi:hypothetical protein
MIQSSFPKFAASTYMGNRAGFEGRLQELLDAYGAKFVPEEPYLADDVERFCICDGPDDGRPMIQCSNGPACLMDWFHEECNASLVSAQERHYIPRGLFEIPKEQGLSA